MMTKSGLRNPKFVVPTHDDLFPSSGYFFISFAKAFTWRLYCLLVVAYLFEEQEEMVIKIKNKKAMDLIFSAKDNHVNANFEKGILKKIFRKTNFSRMIIIYNKDSVDVINNLKKKYGKITGLDEFTRKLH